MARLGFNRIAFATRAWVVAGGLLVALLVVTPTSASATTLPSTITENMTLTAAGNPYTGASTIESGVTVNVEPGVDFAGANLNVLGTLDAQGTAEEPVLFKGNSSSDVVSETPVLRSSASKAS